MRRKPLVIAASCLLTAIAFAIQPFQAGRSGAQEQDNPQTADASGAGAAQTPDKKDPAAELAAQQKATRDELEALSKSITISGSRIQKLKQSIAEIDRSNAGIRQALVDSATKRKKLESQISDGEKKLTSLRIEEVEIHHSLYERRGVLAEVLGALERMGRNPPPALLVKPEDALSSVRSAILLGAVVPGIRHETDKLAADLEKLTKTEEGIRTERASLKSLMTASLEEDRRMNLLLKQNEENATQSAQALAEEKAKSEDLAQKASSLQDLIASLETQIQSVREASLAAAAHNEAQQQAEAQGTEAVTLPPDKNRIAPAYPFSKLTGKLELPVSGEILRNFGDPDGTGHDAQGMTLATNPDAVVTAPADGWVVYAGQFRSYGQMIIMNTGDDYHIVMSGMDKVNVRQGQFVVAGEPVAAMGEKRVASAAALALVTDRPTIYIEFRKGGKSVDSRPWWSAAQLGKARNDT